MGYNDKHPSAYKYYVPSGAQERLQPDSFTRSAGPVSFYGLFEAKLCGSVKCGRWRFVAFAGFGGYRASLSHSLKVPEVYAPNRQNPIAIDARSTPDSRVAIVFRRSLHASA